MANNLVVEPSRDLIMLLKSMPRLGEFYDLQAIFCRPTNRGRTGRHALFPLPLSLCPWLCAINNSGISNRPELLDAVPAATQ